MSYWIIGTIILSVISPIFYTASMLKGKAQPHRVTRLVIWLASLAGFLGVIHSTNTAGKIFALIFVARATYLFLMSLKFGVGGLTWLDITCFVVAILALVAYLITKNGILTISLGILSDLIGYIPTFVKTYRHPESEDSTFFAIEGLASLLGVFAIWELRADVLFPIYFVVSGLIMVVLIYRKKLWPKV